MFYSLMKDKKNPSYLFIVEKFAIAQMNDEAKWTKLRRNSEQKERKNTGKID